MSSELRKKKNKSKYQLWEEMTTEQLISMLGKTGRAKAIRSILRKRTQSMNTLLPVEERIPVGDGARGSNFYALVMGYKPKEPVRRSARIP